MDEITRLHREFLKDIDPAAVRLLHDRPEPRSAAAAGPEARPGGRADRRTAWRRSTSASSGVAGLLSLLQSRRSVRRYSDAPLSLLELAFLLWATQGVTARPGPAVTLRTVPSAGARHAFETYSTAVASKASRRGSGATCRWSTGCSSSSPRTGLAAAIVGGLPRAALRRAGRGDVLLERAARAHGVALRPGRAPRAAAGRRARLPESLPGRRGDRRRAPARSAPTTSRRSTRCCGSTARRSSCSTWRRSGRRRTVEKRQRALMSAKAKAL